MTKLGRNEPCPCGSGRKAKRCCGVERGPVVEDLSRATLAAHARVAALALEGVGDDELGRLWREAQELPRHHVALHFPLPRLVTPEVERLAEAIRSHDEDEALDALDEALARHDRPAARARLATALVELQDTGRLRRRLAAVAILDLESGSRAFLRASLGEAAAVGAGALPTPGGLIVAHSLAA